MNILEQSRKDKTILVVDDAISNIKILAEVLRQEYTILLASSGQQALDIVNSDTIDLILLDIVMPEMNGYEVCRRLKQTEVGKKIPVIFVTVLVGDHSEVRALEAGGIDFITKPVHAASVRAKVKNHLSTIDLIKIVESQSQQIKEAAIEVERLKASKERVQNLEVTMKAVIYIAANALNSLPLIQAKFSQGTLDDELLNKAISLNKKSMKQLHDIGSLNGVEFIEKGDGNVVQITTDDFVFSKDI
jgi:CheY-like chemotaxis protein